MMASHRNDSLRAILASLRKAGKSAWIDQAPGAYDGVSEQTLNSHRPAEPVDSSRGLQCRNAQREQATESDRLTHQKTQMLRRTDGRNPTRDRAGAVGIR